jgi:uncharacterized protein (DUF2062 family)
MPQFILYPVEPGRQINHHSQLYRRVVLPVLALLRMGASPRRLAWSIALGIVIGINPLLGSTTLVCLGAAFALRLNLAASQLANHLMYPVEVLLFIPFLTLGSRVFGTGPIPLSPKLIFTELRANPIALIRSLWQWEWHALVLWVAASLVLAPVIAALLTPVLRKLLVRVEKHQYPLVPTI